MAIFSGQRPHWGEGFVVDEGGGDGCVRLAQRDRKSFALESIVEYNGPTGLDKLNLSEEAEAKLRRIDPADLTETDLASVPGPMRWWVNTYGPHTPAALVHDRFIGSPDGLPEGVSEADIDRYFRFMLRSCGVRFVKRWIMWSATALRTRIVSPDRVKQISVVIWAILALAGTGGVLWAAATSRWLAVLVLGGIAPVLFSLLWGRQFGAGVVAAFLVVPWLAPPALIILVFSIPYLLVERILGMFLDEDVTGSEPLLSFLDPDGPFRRAD